MPTTQPDFASRFIPLHKLLSWGTESLTEAGIATARLDAELLLGAVLGLSRAQVLSRTHTTVRRQQRGLYTALIQRRQHGEPVAYILGKREFYGREFFVDRRVLIPRPETEELVDRALDLLEDTPDARVADIGTGSGAIAVSLAAERPDLRIDGTDISHAALSVAEENAARHDVAERITFHHGSLLEPLRGEAPYALIAANLPYVGTEEFDALAADVRDFEPHSALFAGPDGLDLFPEFLRQLDDYQLLADGGTVLLEIGYAQGDALLSLARQRFPAWHVELHRDLAGLDRIVELRS